MRTQAVNFLRNLGAGLRCVFFAPVSRLAFRFEIAQLLLLFALSAMLDVVGDWIRYGPDAYFSLFGAGNELFAAAVMMLTSAVLALAYRQPSLVLAVPVVVLSGFAYIQTAHVGLSSLIRWATLPVNAIKAIDWALVVWAVAFLIRAVAINLAPSRFNRFARALIGGLLLASPMWFAPLVMPTEPWWRQPAVHGGLDPRYPNPASEPVLAAQQDLLDETLAGLEDQRPGITDLYFVAFAGDGAEDVFRKDVLAAQKVMDEHWETDGRSVVLINNPRTVLETPFATVTHLRAALNEIGASIDPEEDVVMLYLASHGTPNVLQVALAPLELAQITPTALRTLFDESGIKWRIIVVSACYSGSFIEALKDDHTLVITAARADRTSFGCGHQSESTYFGEALFQQGLAKDVSILAAFDAAKNRVAIREEAAGFTPPSNPQIAIGAAMEAKLKELERRGAARRAGRSI